MLTCERVNLFFGENMTDINSVKQRMEASVDNFKKSLAGLRTGRASPGLVENIKADIYGSKTPLSQCATINTPDARTISIQVWDQSNVSAVEKAIQTSELGLNPNTAGNVIILNLPSLTEERRKELTKVASQYAEQARVAIRNIRRDANDETKKAKLPEDQAKSLENQVQKITDEEIKKIDTLFADKEKEIMKV
jgi:ribosome recycling factor